MLNKIFENDSGSNVEQYEYSPLLLLFLLDISVK